MEKFDVYNDIASRTEGDIYLGVVGPVRTGKSTFISKFMEKFVLPNISNKLQKQIATDEMPQSADGKVIMTTQPKFVPANAVKVVFKNKSSANVRLVDCVGYIVDGAVGHKDEDKPRLVKTPWSEKEMPFEKAAEIGTQKVINEYSTIGILITTDGSFTDIERKNYVKAEERVVKELKEQNKPFVIVLNVKNPESESALRLAGELEEKYDVSVVVVNATELDGDKISQIMEKVLLEFPIDSFDVKMPSWLQALPPTNSIISNILSSLKQSSKDMTKMRDFTCLNDLFIQDEYINPLEVNELKLECGVPVYNLTVKDGLFYKVLSEECNEEINDDYELISYIKSFSDSKKKFAKIKDALYNAEQNGYGVVMPSIEEMNLEEPALVKKGGSYGVKLKASAPSLHIMKVDVATEVSPIVGTEKQGEELINYIMKKFEDNPSGIWETNMFGKSISDLVNEEMNGKITSMPKDAQVKVRKTLTKIVNENRGGLICILL